MISSFVRSLPMFHNKKFISVTIFITRWSLDSVDLTGTNFLYGNFCPKQQLPQAPFHLPRGCSISPRPIVDHFRMSIKALRRLLTRPGALHNVSMTSLTLNKEVDDTSEGISGRKWGKW